MRLLDNRSARIKLGLFVNALRYWWTAFSSYVSIYEYTTLNVLCWSTDGSCRSYCRTRCSFVHEDGSCQFWRPIKIENFYVDIMANFVFDSNSGLWVKRITETWVIMYCLSLTLEETRFKKFESWNLSGNLEQWIMSRFSLHFQNHVKYCA